MANLKKKEKGWQCGDICPECKEGRIALMSEIVDEANLDDEPYESGKYEGNSERKYVEGFCVIIYACDGCGKVYSADIVNDFREEEQTYTKSRCER